MTVYAKHINGKQRRLMRSYEALSGFEFLHQEAIDSGACTFREAWNLNYEFLENILAEIQNLNTNGAWKDK